MFYPLVNKKNQNKRADNLNKNDHLPSIESLTFQQSAIVIVKGSHRPRVSKKRSTSEWTFFSLCLDVIGPLPVYFTSLPAQCQDLSFLFFLLCAAHLNKERFDFFSCLRCAYRMWHICENATRFLGKSSSRRVYNSYSDTFQG